ncbi:MAG: efflux RND transporter periplasmic adaptor subunit [Planctomycetota bacterium]
MHPQIQLPGPGQCPICAMDLIPVTPGTGLGGLRRLTIRPDQRALMRVHTVPVERRYPEASLRLVGKVTYDETRLGYITAWVPGRIDELYVDFTGVTVRKGDHMVKLYSPELYTAQQELLQAKVSLVAMQKSNLASLRDSAQGTIDSAREKLRLWGLTAQQVSEIEERGKPEEHVTIYSPSSGLVIHRNAQEGMYVETGTRIFTIADLSHVWVQLDAYESDLAWLRYGQEVSFETEAYRGRKFTGRISFIDPVLQSSTRTVSVRVNVLNPDGLLKPGMFVRAVVRARIAASGQVMDPSLAGKWLSPMHPEIVKDGPGTCDVCGMDLVPAEELGYVAANEAVTEAPLVVPVAASLMTGTRAVVYVELPDTEAPTYEGREVVLGPRAGDFYIVRYGLQEGELVVAEGNFKIDSALQIQAKPSMMNPSGGQSSTGHDHGGSDKMEMAPEEMTSSGLSEAAQARLQLLERQYSGVKEAVATSVLERARASFSEFGDVVKDTEMALFTDKTHEMWMELDMQLSNDAFEGRSVDSMEAARAALKKLGKSIEMMREHLGSRPEAAPTKQVALSEETSEALERVWARYGELHAVLARDDLGDAQAAATALHQAVGSINEAQLPAPGQRSWEAFASTVADAKNQVTGASELSATRAGFERISLAAEAVLRVLGSVAAMHVMHCPMAFDGRGARWLQRSEEVLNPYLGASMLRCGSTVEALEPREMTSAK